MDWVAIALEEYKALREECMVALQMQHAILRYSIGGLLLIFAAALSISSENPHLAGIVLVFLLPGASFLISLIWFGEFWRMLRAGSYIANLELKINKKMECEDGDGPMGWENFLRNSGLRKTVQMKLNYLVTFGLFFGFSVSSCIIGIMFCSDVFNPNFLMNGIFFNASVGIFVFAWVSFSFVTRSP
jgi:hypothetical protein